MFGGKKKAAETNTRVAAVPVAEAEEEEVEEVPAGPPPPTAEERAAMDKEATEAIPDNLEKYKKLVRSVRLFSEMGAAEVLEAAQSLEVKHFLAGELVYDEGDEGHDCWVIESGVVFASVEIFGVTWGNLEWKRMRTYSARASPYFGERGLLRTEQRQQRMTCETDVKLTRITAETFVKCARIRDYKENLIRGVVLFAQMTDDQVGKLAAVIEQFEYKAGDTIASEGTAGAGSYLIETGEVVASLNGAPVKRYKAGELVLEQLLYAEGPNEHTITAEGEVTAHLLTRGDFESKLKPLRQLQEEQFKADPRKLLYDFYKEGDTRGPAGTLSARDLTQDPSSKSSWFVVYRPCSRDSIAKMLGRVGVGKGLNIKGKSAKKNRLSGYVPFMQIHDNKHKAAVEDSPRSARTEIFYRNIIARETALNALTKIMREARELQIDELEIRVIKKYEPKAFGLDIPEPVVKEAYIMRPDISPVIGWETGRPSEPAYMDMNLHSVRGDSEPHVVLYQLDLADPMNSHGLLIAYAEKLVKPVISDFDTFTVGSRSFSYPQPLPPAQVDLVHWALNHTENILKSLNSKGWTQRWLEVLKIENERGFHPDLPKYGFGDPTSYSLTGDVVEATEVCGAVRHGSECFNFYFPQELDDEFLIIWEGFDFHPPWKLVKAGELRHFLLDRTKEGFSFPINPVWTVRDPGWYDVLKALKANTDAKNLNAWFPPEAGVLQRIDEIRAAHPACFVPTDNPPPEQPKPPPPPPAALPLDADGKDKPTPKDNSPVDTMRQLMGLSC